MARPRKPRKPLTAQQKRNAAAKKKGYRNYYDYRIHDYGRIPPGEAVSGEVKKKGAGKRGRSSLRSALRRPERIALIVEVPETNPYTKQREGMRFIVTFTDADIKEYIVPFDEGDWDDWEAFIDYWHEEFEDAEVDFIPYGTVSGE